MPPADVSSTVAKIAADLRLSADSSAVRTPLAAGGGKAAGSQRAYSLGSYAMGQRDGRTDGRRDRGIAKCAPPPPPPVPLRLRLTRKLTAYRAKDRYCTEHSL